MVQVYRPVGWRALSDITSQMDRARYPTVGSWLTGRVERILAAWFAGNPAIAGILNNWHPRWVGEGIEEVMRRDPALADAQLAVAREHGFADWLAVDVAADTIFDEDFEASVDLMLDGDVSGLQAKLESAPRVVSQRSPFGHRATLLHYIAANGVETERQVTPMNAAELVSVLLEAGADPEARMPVYGGEHTVLELLVTSAHPREAGVGRAVAELLSR